MTDETNTLRLLTDSPFLVDQRLRDLSRRDAARANPRALTIAGAYIVGGLIPLSPYMATNNVNTALTWSVALTLVALFIFGAVKGRFTGTNPLRSALQTALIGGLAAAAAFLIARAIG